VPRLAGKPDLILGRINATWDRGQPERLGAAQDLGAIPQVQVEHRMTEERFGPDLAPTRRGEVTRGRKAPVERSMTMASSLVVLKFDTPEGADQALALTENLQKQQLLELLDAAVVTWPSGNKRPKTRHLGDLTCRGAWYGAFWGMLLGWIFFMPFLGAAWGAAVGALAGHFTDYGIGRDFIEQVRGKVTEGTSALFLLLGQVTTDRVVEAFKGVPPFEIIATNLSHEQEAKLKEAFAA
jgi:uncharacterized membrane protein